MCLLAQQEWPPMLLPVILSLLAVVLAALAYLWLRKQAGPHAGKGKGEAERLQRLTVGVSVLLLLLVVLAYVWRGQATWLGQIDQ